VRGSPLIRFVFLALALAGVGWGIARLTSVKKTEERVAQSPGVEKPATATLAVTFRLLLSAPAAQIKIDAGRTIELAADSPLSGTLELDPANPRIALVIHWKSPASVGEYRFAKLTLEPPGRETLTHVFDAAGDIDDFLELPIAE
jgi:hypothetical protein